MSSESQNEPDSSVAEFLEKMYALDTPRTKPELFDHIFGFTNDLLSNSQFQRCDEIFEKLDHNLASASIVTGLLRSTFRARSLLPFREQILLDKGIREKIVASRGSDEADKFFKDVGGTP